MRLIELRLKNLNSLKGEWHIDFSDDAFVNEGIFAITGQTGAGKTTILDAICLALYGETPRISNISKSTNEVMTRQTADCFAEIVIDIDGFHYRCHWSQRRAHGKADGNLQDATHEISHANSQGSVKAGDIIEHKSSLTKKKIIELTRMDFQQFTRSILLAQGSFAAFLSAKADERADILEKITGTDIYATISQRTFEKVRDKQAKLSELEATLKGLALLDPEQEAQLKTEANTLTKTLSEHRLEIDSLNKKIKWCEDISELSEQLVQFQQTLVQSKQAQADFTAEAQRLDNANKALEIEGVFNQLQHKRQAHESLAKELYTIDEQLPVVQHQLTIESEQLSQSIKAEKEAADKLNEALPIIAKTRELDAEIAQQQYSFDQNNAQKNKLSNASTALNQQLQQYRNEYNNKHLELASLNQYFTENSQYQQLAEDIISLDKLCVQLKGTLQSAQTAYENKKSKLNEQHEQHAKLESLTTTQADIETDLKQKKSELLSLQQRQEALLQGQSIANLREQQEYIDHTSALLQQLKQQLNDIEQLRDQLDANQQITAALKIKTDEEQQQINEYEQKLSDLKSQRKDKQLTLEQQRQIFQLQAKLEDYIDLLETNKPCPLCGSTQHPYLDSEDDNLNHPTSKSDSEQQAILAEINQQIQTVDDQIEQLDTHLSQCRVNLATAEHDLNQKQNQFNDFINQLNVKVSQCQQQIISVKDSATDYGNNADSVQSLLAKFQVIAPIEMLVTQLNGLDGNNLSQLQQALNAVKDSPQSAIESIRLTIEALTTLKQGIKKTIEDDSELTTEKQQVEDDVRGLDSKLQIIISDSNNIKYGLDYLQKGLLEVDQQITGFYDSISTGIDQLQQLVAKYRTNQNPADDESNNVQHCLQQTFETLNQLQRSVANKQGLSENHEESVLTPLRDLRTSLKAMLDTYKAKSDLKLQITNQLETLSVQITDREHRISETEVDIKQLSQTISAQSQQIEQLRQRRSVLFGEKDLQSEENQLRSQLDIARNTLTKIKEKHSSTEYQIKQLTDSKTLKEDQLGVLNTDLSQQETVFTSMLAEQCFDNEQDFLQARLPKHERDQLSSQKQQIAQALQLAQNSVSTTETKLREKQENPLTTEDKLVLENQRAEKQKLADQLIEQLGAINQQLKTNEERKGEQQSQLAIIAQQKQDLKVWQQLNELIGSATGKKFRTFAQGLTFDIMVANANTQLQKMSDRYLLIRDEESPLELNVIDNYQAGEVRSTKNLSGGEGFIISLALALGLSNMASHNIRVDSLFLDEGFGTLDEDSLDIALNTLTGLQQEGKLIGVISHVQALKERIHTQIKVEKLSGGHSQISGPGCLRI